MSSGEGESPEYFLKKMQNKQKPKKTKQTNKNPQPCCSNLSSDPTSWKKVLPNPDNCNFFYMVKPTQFAPKPPEKQQQQPHDTVSPLP